MRELVTTAVVALVALGLGPAAGAATASGWTSPLNPLVVVRGFEPPPGPYAPGHRGVDLGGSSDQPVRAAGDGVVTYVGKVAGIGVVVVTHGRIRTTYQPLLGTIVVGAPVSAGDQIGRLTGMGSHCRPRVCLHWGAAIGEDYIDPLALLDPAPSRLLPYWDTEVGSAGRGVGPVPPPGGITGVIATGLSTPAWSRMSRRHSEVDAVAAKTSDEHRSLPAGGVAAIAIVGGVAAGAGLLAIRRRRG